MFIFKIVTHFYLLWDNSLLNNQKVPTALLTFCLLKNLNIDEWGNVTHFSLHERERERERERETGRERERERRLATRDLREGCLSLQQRAMSTHYIKYESILDSVLRYLKEGFFNRLIYSDIWIRVLLFVIFLTESFYFYPNYRDDAGAKISGAEKYFSDKKTAPFYWREF